MSPDESATWYRDAVIYEVHVKAFCDSAGDGMGDFRGLTAKLDYLRDLGVTAIWLLPFYPSPLKDDGYDISDFFAVYRPYGTLADFKEFLWESHRRGIRVITELVINHTSDKHAWFVRARTSPPGSTARDFYVWTDDPKKYRDARIIFKDTETSNWTWDPVAQSYYWHRFYSHQPDLNFDNPEVQEAVFKVMNFWLKLGVDGLRLDAVPYLFEREGTNCENLPETHRFLKELRSHMDSKYPGRMLLAEANQWPSDAAAYFGEGDECNMAFHFPLMPRLFMAIEMEDRFPVIDILRETPPIPAGCQWAIFLRNHDELTLEMVTDEERDYMYRVYARDRRARLNLGIRRRLAPLLGNDRRKIELMNVLLFTLPGTPVVYYGDEIGMGDNFYLGDRNGVRTPMQWSAEMNSGFSKTNPQRLYLPVSIEPRYHYEVVNVENQDSDPASLLWWFRRFTHIRRQFKALSRGTIRFVYPENEKVLAFVRTHEKESVLVVANLSKKPQAVDIDLSDFEGDSPLELLGGNVFPDIGKEPYRLTVGAHGYFVFSLVEKAKPPAEFVRPVAELRVQRGVREIFEGVRKATIESSLLPPFLLTSRWFGGKARAIERTFIRDVTEVKGQSRTPYFNLLVDVSYSEGLPETYFLPLAYASDEAIAKLPEEARPKPFVRLTSPTEAGVVYDAGADPAYGLTLLQNLSAKRAYKGRRGTLNFLPTNWFRRLFSHPEPDGWSVRVLAAEHSNTSFVLADKVVLKLMRRVEEGTQPEVELGQLLTKRGFPSVPPFMGSIEYEREEAEPTVVAVAEGFVSSQGDAWKLFSAEFENFAETTARGQHDELLQALQPEGSLLELARSGSLDKLFEMASPLFAENVALLGKRTAEFHLALAGDSDDPDFAPEPFGYLGQTSLSRALLSAAQRTLQAASRVHLAKPAQQQALTALLAQKEKVLKVFERLKALRIDSLRCRTHGDYHLGQVLYTGKDFVIIDFEGEPARSLSERRLKRSPLRDAAGMVRSFHYVAVSTVLTADETKLYASNPKIRDWARLWYLAVSAAFLRAYLERLRGTRLIPSDDQTLNAMFDSYLMEKALYELTYEMNSRPDWVGIPLEGMAEILGLKTSPAEKKTAA